MTNKSASFSKRKSARKVPVFKSARSAISATSSSLYSGIASAERAIQNPGPESSNQLSTIFGNEDQSSSWIQYHPWETKYNRISTRENIKKAMTKEPYTETKYLINHANENITTQEECSPVLIPMKAIRIEELIIHGEDKPARKSIVAPIPVPNSARQVRIKSITPIEQLLPPILPKRSSVTQIPVQNKRSAPIIVPHKNIKQKSNSSSADPITGRIKLRNDPSMVRRPSGRISMDTVHETIKPLAIYA